YIRPYAARRCLLCARSFFYVCSYSVFFHQKVIGTSVHKGVRYVCRTWRKKHTISILSNRGRCFSIQRSDTKPCKYIGGEYGKMGASQYLGNTQRPCRHWESIGQYF